MHAELRVHDGRATVIEVAARTIGGLCSRALSFSTGRSLEELVIAHALGLALGPTAAVGASGVLMVPIPRAGTLVGVDGQDEARAVPGVTEVEITIAAGPRRRAGTRGQPLSRLRLRARRHPGPRGASAAPGLGLSRRSRRGA